MTKTNATAAPAATSNAPEMPIKTKHLAIKFGIKATQLRRVLRSMPEYADGVHTNYAWAENDKRIGEIEKQIKKLAGEREARKAAAQKALAERVAKAEVAKQVDAKAGLAKA